MKSNSVRVSKNPQKNWENPAIQFPRLIAELESAGAFTAKVISDLKESTDLTESQIYDIIDAAQETWDNIKQKI